MTGKGYKTAGSIKKALLVSFCLLFLAGILGGACSKGDSGSENEDSTTSGKASDQPGNVEFESGDDGFKMKFKDEKTGEEVSWDVKGGNGKITTTGKDGESGEIAFGNSDLPEGWPEDFPLYDGQMGGHSRGEAGNQVNYAVNVISEDSMDEIMSWYKEKLPENGYEITGSMSHGGAMKDLQFKAGNLEGNITMTKHQDKVSIINTLIETD